MFTWSSSRSLAKEYLTVRLSRISEWSLRRSVRISNPLSSVWTAKTTRCIYWFTTRRSIPCPRWSTVSKAYLVECSGKSALILLHAIGRAFSGLHRTLPPHAAVRRSLCSRRISSNRRRHFRATGAYIPTLKDARFYAPTDKSGSRDDSRKPARHANGGVS
jgi:hypothetical protein